MTSTSVLQQPFSIPSPDEILAHPKFTDARGVWIDGLLSLYENDAFLTRLFTGTGRLVTFIAIVILYATYDAADRETWPTMSLLQEMMALSQLTSRRTIETVVARFVETGYVQRFTLGADRRARLLMPTEKGLMHDSNRLSVYYAALARIFPQYGDTSRIVQDRVFWAALCRVSRDGWTGGVDTVKANPLFTFLQNREAGMMILMKVIQISGASGASSTTFSNLAQRFGISRTHVRRFLHDAERQGLIRLSNDSIVPQRSLFALIDRVSSEWMARLHVVHHIATASIATAR